MKHIHIQGMGITGSLMAHRLALLDIPFTWNDINLPKVAWQASTGAIYPSGSDKFGPDEECRLRWLDWAKGGFIREHIEPGQFVFSTKSAPHGGKYPTESVEGKLQIAEPRSLHLNAQTLVASSRSQFNMEHLIHPKTMMDMKNDPNVMTVVAHGWGERLGHVYWGWTRLVKLNYDKNKFDEGIRPAFYFREGRFIMAYAYPVPGTEFWYAGSSIIKQASERRHNLDCPGKYEKWKSNFERLGQGLVTVGEEGEFLEGWRPASSQEDTAWVKQRGNTILTRPLWNSGIRHFPKQWAGVCAALGIEDPL